MHCAYLLISVLYKILTNLFYAVLVYRQSDSLDPHFTLSFDYSDYEPKIKILFCFFVDPEFLRRVDQIL